MKLVIPIALLALAVVLCYIIIGILRLVSKHISRGRLILLTAMLFGWFNFLLVVIWHLFIGGRAAAGMIQDGHYYVREGSEYTEVSSIVYWTDLWYTRISEILFAVTFVIVGHLVIRTGRRRKKSISSERTPDALSSEESRSQHRRMWIWTVPMMLVLLGAEWLLLRLVVPLHPLLLHGAILIGCGIAGTLLLLLGVKKLGGLFWCAGFGLPICFFIWLLLGGAIDAFQNADPRGGVTFLLLVLFFAMVLIAPSAALSSILFCSPSSKKTPKQAQW